MVCVSLRSAIWGFRWGNGPLCLSPASNLLVDSYWGEQKKEQKDGERRKHVTRPHRRPFLALGLCKSHPSTLKALLFTLHPANFYSPTRSRHQCHIFRSISWFSTSIAPPQIFPLLISCDFFSSRELEQFAMMALFLCVRFTCIPI